MDREMYGSVSEVFLEHEHFRDFKHGNNRSKFAQHLLENKHGIGPMENIMHIIHITGKGKMMDMLEKFYIYREAEANNQINDKLTAQNNAVFKTIVCEDPYRVNLTFC
jgi:hypothetical protein